MSLYAIIRSSDTNGPTLPPDMMRGEDVAVWDGIRAGVFRAETLRNANCGTVIGLVADEEADARQQLDRLPFIAGGNVDIQLGKLGSEPAISQPVDCADVLPLAQPQERLPQVMHIMV